MQIGRFVMILVLLGFIAACNGGGGSDHSPPSTAPTNDDTSSVPDTPQATAPTVKFALMDPSVAVSGDLKLAADVKSDTAISRVVFTVDDAVIAQRDTAPFTVTWKSVDVNDGEHLLRVTATNSASQSGTDQITVRTYNAAARKIPINFTPFGAKDPNTGAVLSRAELLAKLAPWRHRASCVRTFGVSGGLDLVPQLAAELGIDCVAVTIWLGSDLAANDSEIAKAIALAKSASNVKYVTVGSETLLRGDLTIDALIAYIGKVKAELPDKVVTTSDTPSGWLDHPRLVDAVDQVWVNIYPFLGGVPLDVSIAVLNAQYQDLQAHANGKAVVIAETGWPTCGSAVDAAIPSETNSTSYALNLISFAETLRVPYFLMASSDESYKAEAHGTAYDGCWGLAKEDGTFKTGLENIFAGHILTDNWSNVPAAPQLLSPIGETDSVSPVFRWSNSGAGQYRFYIVDVAGKATSVVLDAKDIGCGADETQCAYTSAVKLSPDGAQWRVQSLNAKGSGFWSEPAEIFVIPCSHDGEMPCAPLPVAPLNVETDATPTLTFTRRSTEDTVPWSEDFLIQVADVNGLTVYVDGLTREMLGCANDRSCEYVSPTLAQGEACWRVGARVYGVGYGPWSACTPFKVVQCGNGARPCAPVPTGPIGLNGASRLTFSFLPVATATQYSISLQDETLNAITERGSVFSAVELGCADGVSVCKVQAEHQLTGGQWTVQAINAGGQMGPKSKATEYSIPKCNIAAGCHRVVVSSSTGVGITLDGISVFYREGGGGGGRGICVAEFSPSGALITGADRDARCFDPWGLGAIAMTDLQKRLDKIDVNSYTVIAIGDDAGDAFRTEAGYRMLEAWGATAIRNVGFRDAYALITRNRTALAEDYSVSPTVFFTNVAVFGDIAR